MPWCPIHERAPVQNTLGSLIKRHELDWEAIPLSELIILAEHVEKTLEQGKIKKADKHKWSCSYNSCKSWETFTYTFQART